MRHHIQVLIRARQVASVEIGRETHYFQYSRGASDPIMCQSLARARHGSAPYVLSQIVAEPGLHFNELGRRLKMRPKALARWLRFLGEAGLVTKTGRLQRRLYAAGPALTPEVFAWLLNDQLLGFVGLGLGNATIRFPWIPASMSPDSFAFED